MATFALALVLFEPSSQKVKRPRRRRRDERGVFRISPDYGGRAARSLVSSCERRGGEWGRADAGGADVRFNLGPRGK